MAGRLPRVSTVDLAACTEVQLRVFDSGYPCPQPLAGPALLGEYEATAERYVSGGLRLPDSGRSTRPSPRSHIGAAGSDTRASALVGARASMGGVAPQPGWSVAAPEDLDVDLNEVDGPSWIDAAAQAVRRKLREGQDHAVIGHADWITDNLRWHGQRLLVTNDWDSVIADSEAVIAGLAAAIYLHPELATVAETHEFLDAYATARGRPFSPSERQRCQLPA